MRRQLPTHHLRARTSFARIERRTGSREHDQQDRRTAPAKRLKSRLRERPPYGSCCSRHCRGELCTAMPPAYAERVNAPAARFWFARKAGVRITCGSLPLRTSTSSLGLARPDASLPWRSSRDRIVGLGASAASVVAPTCLHSDRSRATARCTWHSTSWVTDWVTTYPQRPPKRAPTARSAP
jgi:hypothetical protein